MSRSDRVVFLSLFLHLYQPPTQFAKVLKSITDASYRRLLSVIRKYPSAKLTLNIPGSLTEQLAAHADLRRLLADFADLVKLGQIELVGSAAYHPLLTEIPLDEVRRQIFLNDEINRKYFGEIYHPRGFFPPEMAVNNRVLKVVEELGFDWIIVDESAIALSDQKDSENSVNQKIGPSENQKVRGSDSSDALKYRRTDARSRSEFSEYPLGIFVRNTDLSVKVAFSQIRTIEELKKEITRNQPPETSYQILAMDGETFGHHQPGQFKFLEELLASGDFELLTLSELSKKMPVGAEVEIQESSWGPWERWKNPENPIHKLQWELFRLAMDVVKNSKHQVPNLNNQIITKSQIQNSKRSDIGYLNLFGDCDFGFGISVGDKGSLTFKQRKWLKARCMLDKALHSDQFWWAAATPCWHYQMVERGARMLRDVVLMVPDVSEKRKSKAKEFYAQIISTGKELHGECIIEG